MALSSPLPAADAPFRLTVNVNGAALKSSLPIQSVEIVTAVGRVPFAEIEILIELNQDSGESTDLETLKVGDVIEILAGYGSEEVVLFKGIAVKHRYSISQNDYAFVLICKHECVKMTYSYAEKLYADKTDSAIITDVLNTAGLTPDVDSTTFTHKALYRPNCSDWDFVLARAEFNGLLVIATPTGLSVKKPVTAGTAVFALRIGESIKSLNLELAGDRQPTAVTAAAWSIDTLALATQSSEDPNITLQGSAISDLEKGQISLFSGGLMGMDELKVWANGHLLRNRLSAYTGDAQFMGNNSIAPGMLVELDGIDSRFNGNAFVSEVRHSIRQGDWSTHLKFGLDNQSLHEKIQITPPPGTGHLPAIAGLQAGTVLKISEDPDSLYRVKVALATTDADSPGIWARLASFYSTSGAGAFFYPEIGDEVVMGFMDSDPRYPVILGMLHSSTKAPANTNADDKNDLKSFISKSLIKIEFNDKNKILTLATPAANSIILDDKAKSITLQDQHGNMFVMDESGISLTSAKDIVLDAKGGITVSATSKVAISSKADVSLEGLNVSLNAKTGLTAKGTATAELSAAGQTTVKGAIVMIN